MVNLPRNGLTRLAKINDQQRNEVVNVHGASMLANKRCITVFWFVMGDRGIVGIGIRVYDSSEARQIVRSGGAPGNNGVITLRVFLRPGSRI